MTPRSPVWQAIAREALVEYLARQADELAYTLVSLGDRPIESLPDELRPHARRGVEELPADLDLSTRAAPLRPTVTYVPVRALALYATGAPPPNDPEDL